MNKQGGNVCVQCTHTTSSMKTKHAMTDALFNNWISLDCSLYWRARLGAVIQLRYLEVCVLLLIHKCWNSGFSFSVNEVRMLDVLRCLLTARERIKNNKKTFAYHHFISQPVLNRRRAEWQWIKLSCLDGVAPDVNKQKLLHTVLC